MSTRKEIVKGIAAYAHEQQVLLRLLRKRGQFTEREFDTWFRGREYQKPKIRPRGPINGDSLILGGMMGGEWAWWLDLLQHMMAVGLVVTSAENGLVVYRATP
jgi:hypothetical protein